MKIFKKILLQSLALLLGWHLLAYPSFSSTTTPLQNLQTHFTSEVNNFLTAVTPDKNSALQDKLQAEDDIANNPLGISFYRPNYILPFYYTFSPYFAVYQNITPDQQQIMQQEFKAQLSLQMPIWKNILYQPISLNVAYTQVSYWQIYASSQYFRETNYEPEIFLSNNFHPNWLLNIGFNHQSNGRGGDLERSWNRAYFDLQFSGENWLISLKPWLSIFKKVSSGLHNSDIVSYLGHERILFTYKFERINSNVSLELRNVEKINRLSTDLTFSFPLTKKLKGYLQLFQGFGQSLIEYDHKTKAIGIGISLNDWI